MRKTLAIYPPPQKVQGQHVFFLILLSYSSCFSKDTLENVITGKDTLLAFEDTIRTVSKKKSKKKKVRAYRVNSKNKTIVQKEHAA